MVSVGMGSSIVTAGYHCRISRLFVTSFADGDSETVSSKSISDSIFLGL